MIIRLENNLYVADTGNKVDDGSINKVNDGEKSKSIERKN